MEEQLRKLQKEVQCEPQLVSVIHLSHMVRKQMWENKWHKSENKRMLQVFQTAQVGKTDQFQPSRFNNT